MDFTKFFEAVPENAPIVIFIVLGLVTLYGKFGLAGKAQLGAALATGTVFGAGFMVAALGIPGTFAGWFSVLVYGLAMGLVASGIYETGKGVINRANQEQTARENGGTEPPQ
jgi:hypothetical protein